MLYLSNGVTLGSSVNGNVLTPELNNSERRVLLINTRSYQSDLADPKKQRDVDSRSFFLEMLRHNDDLTKKGVPPYDVAQLDELCFSSDQASQGWVQLARLIQHHYHEYCGFVVENGTDNMVTTSTALSFMLENLGKPVVFTGSLIPVDRIYTDMKRNIILALAFASCGHLCEVCILFDEHLYRANRTVKVSRCSLRPYDSPHYPPLASMEGGAMELRRDLLRPFPHGKLHVMVNMGTPILTLQLGPAVSMEVMLKAVEVTRARAIILSCYGSGNGPTRGEYMRRFLTRARERDIVVAICTQNLFGSVNLNEYEAGRQLAEAGAIGAFDMTHEAVFVKLKYLFGLNLSPDEVRKYMQTSLNGEISSPSSRL